MVQLRAIAVGKCPDGFATQITKFTNLQNAVSQQDFVALDSVQSRLSIDFAVEGRRYAFKWGTDPDPTGVQGCTLKEATVALACADPDPWYAVQAKREIGQLWHTASDKYKALFHENLTAQRVWNAVNIMRNVELVLALSDRAPRTRLVAVHLNLVILHLVFASEKMAKWNERNDMEELCKSARELSIDLIERLYKYVSEFHEGDYLASLSKNQDKCQAMVKQMLVPIKTPPVGQATQLDLFSEPT